MDFYGGFGVKSAYIGGGSSTTWSFKGVFFLRPGAAMVAAGEIRVRFLFTKDEY